MAAPVDGGPLDRELGYGSACGSDREALGTVRSAGLADFVIVGDFGYTGERGVEGIVEKLDQDQLQINQEIWCQTLEILMQVLGV